MLTGVCTLGRTGSVRPNTPHISRTRKLPHHTRCRKLLPRRTLGDGRLIRTLAPVRLTRQLIERTGDRLLGRCSAQGHRNSGRVHPSLFGAHLGGGRERTVPDDCSRCAECAGRAVFAQARQDRAHGANGFDGRNMTLEGTIAAPARNRATGRSDWLRVVAQRFATAPHDLAEVAGRGRDAEVVRRTSKGATSGNALPLFSKPKEKPNKPR